MFYQAVLVFVLSKVIDVLRALQGSNQACPHVAEGLTGTVAPSLLQRTQSQRRIDTHLWRGAKTKNMMYKNSKKYFNLI